VWRAGGKYAKTIKEISVALGRDPNSLDLAKRHPFDLTLVRIPPGKLTAFMELEAAIFGNERSH
jgi:hypothetical protein